MRSHRDRERQMLKLSQESARELADLSKALGDTYQIWFICEQKGNER